ncbi:MAG: hypothetical protein OFPI_20240 [Osedax symbiont Rs2]|nr:MAG: hypothetical protein OFPI_20240 [Osedax symbiont Rs2]
MFQDLFKTVKISCLKPSFITESVSSGFASYHFCTARLS